LDFSLSGSVYGQQNYGAGIEKRANIQRPPHDLLRGSKQGLCGAFVLKTGLRVCTTAFSGMLADLLPAFKPGALMLRPIVSSLLLLAASGTALPVSAGTPASEQTPRIAGYGAVFATPDAAFQPDSTRRYKLVFKVSDAASNPSDLNPALNEVARVINLYARAGVPASQVEAVVAVNGGATPALLDEPHYRKLFNTANPNLGLIRALDAAGVKVTLCSQALAWHHYDPSWVATPVIRTPSALTTLTTLQNQGYALLDTQGAAR
jgi:intracellular sulfur oxidation DsrE/DsrF family protein